MPPKEISPAVPPVEFMAFLSDPDSAAVVARYVAERRLTHALVRQGGIADAVAALRAQNRPPLRLMVDVSASDDPLGDLTRLAEACTADVSVVVVASRTDTSLFRDLLRLGVDDYLTKPLTLGLLRRVAAHPERKAAPC
ncbi:hypothetical protein GALL_277670 [mine drainage metagenome]|uniref:Uncharacterized protein n=1 Tax=mine drainage metagenome TaxID=410659 RepID=A0A1J5RQG5_9ZZZZ